MRAWRKLEERRMAVPAALYTMDHYVERIKQRYLFILL